MHVHSLARTPPLSRAVLVHRALHQRHRYVDLAAAFGVSIRTVAKWVARYRVEGDAGLADRSSCPRHMPTRLDAERVAMVVRLRGQRWTTPAISRALGLPRATVSKHLRQQGLGGRLRPLEAPPPPVRYTRARPGELLHVDTKKLGRIQGVGHRITGDWHHRPRTSGREVLYVAIDDASRLTYAEVLPDERGPTAVGFLTRALAWFARHGLPIERVMTDNGSPFVSRAFTARCRAGRVRHRHTRPYRPRTNGKAERLIQTALREWAYATPYDTSAQRTLALSPWLAYYNGSRRHTALGDRPPLIWLQAVHNVLANHT
jgi:transposase InsO family protein